MIRFFARHPTAANLLMLAIAALGFVVLPALRRETFPDFAASAVQIQVIYPGASAEGVEETIIQRIEDAVDGIEHVDEVRSQATEGAGSVTVEMDDDGDMTTFMAEVRSEVEAIPDLPAGAEDPLIARIGFTSQVVTIAVTGPMSTPDLKSYCEQLKRKLQQYEEISLVDVAGFSDRQLQIRPKSGALAQYGLSVKDLATVVGAQSFDLPAGTIETRDSEVLVRFADERRTPDELAELVVVAGSTGGEVRLGDIATIEDTFETEEEQSLFDGKRAGMLQVTKTTTEDSLEIMAAVEEFIADVEPTKPPGVELSVTEDMATIVADRLNLVLANGYQGLLLVFLSLWLFFNLRLAFWVAAGLPVSFLGALFVMDQIGYSLNMMTLMAMLVALGLLMDDAIVLAENVAAHMARGKSAVVAAIDGVREVQVGVLSSFATTLCVFVPLAFLDGNIGKVLLVVPVVLLVVLAVSLIEAFLILPNHLSHVKQEERSGWRQRFDRAFERLRDRHLARAVGWTVRNRYLTAGLTVAVFMVSLGLFAGGILKFQAFPSADGDVVQLRVLLPQGTPLAKTEQVVEQAVEALERVDAELTPKQPGKAKLVKSVSVRTNYNPDAGESGPHLATISADLLGAENRNATIDEITTLWRQEVGPLSDVISANYAEPSMGPAGDPISIRVQGDDLAELEAASQEIQQWFAEFQGVLDLSSDLRPGKPEMKVRLKPGALSANIQASTVANQLRAALSGSLAAETQLGTEGYEVSVRLDPSDTDTLSDLDYFQVSLGNQVQVPLGTIATIESSRGYARISRVDGLRTVTVTGDIDTELANAAELVALFQTEELPKVLAEHPGIRIDLEGESKESAKTMSSMARNLLIGLFGIFILLSFQFRSYVEPVVVMVAIPLALIGVIWGTLAMGNPLTLPGVLGFCALAGVVVNDSILLVEFIKRARRAGASIEDAVQQASRERFRAVVLTSVTTVAGLVPLMFESSRQAEILIYVAASIVFGILASTTLVLLVLPPLYAILGDLGWVERLEGDREDDEEQPAASLEEPQPDGA